MARIIQINTRFVLTRQKVIAVPNITQNELRILNFVQLMRNTLRSKLTISRSESQKNRQSALPDGATALASVSVLFQYDARVPHPQRFLPAVPPRRVHRSTGTRLAFSRSADAAATASLPPVRQVPATAATCSDRQSFLI